MSQKKEEDRRKSQFSLKVSHITKVKAKNLYLTDQEKEEIDDLFS